MHTKTTGGMEEAPQGLPRILSNAGRDPLALSSWCPRIGGGQGTGDGPRGGWGRLRFVLAAAVVVPLLALWLGVGTEAWGDEAAGRPELRVMTFNIRFGTAPDGPNIWPLRRDLVMQVIRDFRPDLLGVQEALREQVDELLEELEGYAALGRGREADGSGEYSSILYRRDRFDVSASGTLWLSDTPATPGSRSWGNTLPRICTWARFLDRSTSNSLVMLNTHWDHQSEQARLESGKMVARWVGENAGENEPCVVTGDFNAPEESAPFRALASGTRRLDDTFRRLHPDAQQAGTFHGFQGKAGERKIDGVLVTSECSVLAAEIVRTEHEGRYPSDHFPVTAVLELR